MAKVGLLENLSSIWENFYTLTTQSRQDQATSYYESESNGPSVTLQITRNHNCFIVVVLTIFCKSKG